MKLNSSDEVALSHSAGNKCEKIFVNKHNYTQKCVQIGPEMYKI